MTLAEYLDSTDERQADFAARIDATQGAVSRFARFQTMPSLQMAHRIEVASGGAVPITSWLRPLINSLPSPAAE